MKVRIETDAAARRFGCAVGEYRDLQHPDALAMIETKDVSAAEDAKAPAKKKAPGKKAAASRK